MRLRDGWFAVDKICFHAIVSGHVQGVYYRANTQRKALELNLTGWVQNLPNGTVEVVACGEKNKIDLLEKWLWKGPAPAIVGKVQSNRAPYKAFDGFVVK